jgi:hypothetical protein
MEMIKMNQLIRFEKDADETEELVEDIISEKTGDELGKIYYNPDWKKWVADFGSSYFDAECLSRIVRHLLELKQKS